ncbi:NAD(P)-binding protein [Aureobasidium pullulans]|nr:NAD(P)-binding protein [Aureobasidium pullulans]
MAKLRSVLVVGGCGFVGHHIVDHLLAKDNNIKISVMGRSNGQHRRPQVEYLEGDLLSESSVHSIFQKVNPQVVINTVAPITFPQKGTPESHYKINVDGTSNLLRAAASCPATAGFIYTSSAHTVLATDYTGAKESDPVDGNRDSRRFPTSTKAIADAVTLAANNSLPIDAGGLRTATIRPCVIFGEDDSQLLPTVLSQLDNNQQNFQIGPNSALYDFVYVGNVAEAHILAAKALVREAAEGSEKGKQVSGESFFVTNDDPQHFYDFMKKVWAASGYDVSKLKPRVIPTKVALGLGSASDLATWAFTLGRKSPSSLSRESIEHLCLNRTHDISKVKERLHYTPLVSVDEGIRRGVKSLS